MAGALDLNHLSPSAALQYLDAAPDAIIAVRRDGEITMVNEQAVTMFGYPRAELVGRHVEVLVPEVFRKAHLAHRTRYTARPKVRQMGDPGARLHARHADGSMLPVEIALSPVTVDESVTVMAVIRDVSERVAAEAELEGIRRSLDTVADAVFMFDPESLEFSYANAGASAQTGYGREELIGGMTPLHIKPLFDEPDFRRLMAPVLNGSRSSITFETIHRTKAGEDLPVEAVLSWPETGHDHARPMVAIVRDVTERRLAEDRLRSSESAFRSAFDEAAVPMAMLDLSNPDRRTIVRANDALADLLGSSTEQLIGVDDAELTHADDRTTSASSAAGLLSGELSYRQEKRYRRKDGTFRWVTVDASLIDAAVAAPRALVHIIDVTRRIEAERDRDRREELLVTLASVRKSVLDDAPIDDVLRLVTAGIIEAVDGALAFIATPGTDEELAMRACSGDSELEWIGPALLENGAAGRALKTAEIVQLDEVTGLDVHESGSPSPTTGPVVVVPLRTANSVEGLLVVAQRKDRGVWGTDDIEVARSLASEAAVSLVLARAREDRRRMFLIEDRERIARDLHDVVIQRLFATGMRLQAATNRPELLRQRAAEVVGDLDETIADIRNSIFQLTQPDESVVGELERLVERHRAIGRNEIELVIEGDPELLDPGVVDHLLPVVNELLSNVERHAHATSAHLTIQATEGDLTVAVTDDGVGLANDTGPGFGLRNLRRRADQLGGEFEYGPRADGPGTESRWAVPLTG